MFWIIGFLLMMAVLPLEVSSAGRPPPKKRDGTAVRRHAIRPEEKVARDAAIARFEEWMSVASPRSRLEDLARRDVPTLSVLLEEFCYQSFETRWPVGSLRHLLTGIIDRFGWLRNVLSGPWKVLHAIEKDEPSVPRSPLPVTWLQALVVMTISLQWFRMAASLLLGFYGLLRPSELYGLRRRDVLLGSEHHMGPFLLVRVLEPKSRWRGAKQQYVRIDEASVVTGLNKLLARLRPDELIWQMSPARFATRLRRIALIAVGRGCSVLPSSLRTGGATWFFQSSQEDLPRLLWKGRWRDARVLGSYIQEITAAILNARLSAEDAARVAELADMFCGWMIDLICEPGMVAADDAD